jgi:hypothetical protein
VEEPEVLYILRVCLFTQIWSRQVTVLFALISLIILLCGLLGSLWCQLYSRLLYSCRRLFTSNIYVCLSVTWWKTDPLSLNLIRYVMRKHHIIISAEACLTLQYYTILYNTLQCSYSLSLKRHNFREKGY